MTGHEDSAASLPNCTVISGCRICGSSEFTSVIDLGHQHVGTHAVAPDTPEPILRYPLHVIRCSGKHGCGLVQLEHTLDPNVLYKNYGYRSGINRTMRANLTGIVADACDLVDLTANDIVLDIGCNDGTLLDAYRGAGVHRLGFDPSRNVAEAAIAKGHQVIVEPFSAQSFFAARPESTAKVITSIAMFYDLQDPMRFTADVASVLDPAGVWVIELSYLPSMLRNRSYDTICHEHLEYYSLRQIEWLLGRNGLQVQRVELNDVNGGSVRVFIQHKGADTTTHVRGVRMMRESEECMKLSSDTPYGEFRDAVLDSRAKLRALLADIANADQSVYVYGASTKGNTILQFCGIDHTTVPKAADRNPRKWGLTTPGTGITIISEAQARVERPDYFLVLPWHFLEEFAEREAEFLDQGGKFILPLPQVRVLGSADFGRSAHDTEQEGADAL